MLLLMVVPPGSIYALCRTLTIPLHTALAARNAQHWHDVRLPVLELAAAPLRLALAGTVGCGAQLCG